MTWLKHKLRAHIKSIAPLTAYHLGYLTAGILVYGLAIAILGGLALVWWLT